MNLFPEKGIMLSTICLNRWLRYFNWFASCERNDHVNSIFGTSNRKIESISWCYDCITHYNDPVKKIIKITTKIWLGNNDIILSYSSTMISCYHCVNSYYSTIQIIYNDHDSFNSFTVISINYDYQQRQKQRWVRTD